MRTSKSVLLALSVAALVVIGPAVTGAANLHAQRGGGGKGGSGKPPATTKPKKEFWAVVQVGEDYQVVKKSDLKKFKKDLETSYRNDLKSWNQSKKDAQKAKEKFDAPKPVKPKIKVIRKNFKFETEAKTHVQVLKERASKKGGKKEVSVKGDNKKETYVVLDMDGKLRVASKSELSTLRKQANDGYKQALKDYNQAKKDAAKKKMKFEDPKPQKSTIKTVGPSFATQDQAQEYLQKMLAKKTKKATAGKSTGKDGKNAS